MNITKIPSPGLALLFAKLYEGPYDYFDPAEQGQITVATTPTTATVLVSLPTILTPTIYRGKAQGVIRNASPAAQILRIGPLVGFAGTPCGVAVAPGGFYQFSDLGVALYGMSDTAGGLADVNIMRTSLS